MDIFEYLDELQADISEKDFQEIEDKYFKICSELAGQDRAKKIEQISLDTYINELKSGLEQSIKIAQEQAARAIYFEYDLDNNWDSAFFICGEYSPLQDEDDDWACDWNADLGGPSLKEFAAIYELDGFASNEAAIGTTIYLAARTVISYAKAYQALSDKTPIAVCIAFHDQDPLIRIKG